MAERRLRILQVSNSDIQGGAEKVAWNLFNAYRVRGHFSRLAVGTKRTDDPDVTPIPNDSARGNWYRFFQGLSTRLMKENSGILRASLSRLAGIWAEPMRRLDYYRGVEDFHFPGTVGLLRLDGRKPDILHAHNLHGAYFDLRRLPTLSKQVPVVLTLHDAWLLSGHCAHSFSCEKWRSGCGRCPDLAIYPATERDATAFNWRRKQQIFAHSKLYVATPSNWLMARVQESMLAPAIIGARVVANGVDLSVYRPSNQQEARLKLGVPQQARVLLTVGVGVRGSIWRDAQTLRSVVERTSEHLRRQNLMLIALGEGSPPDHYGRAEVRFIPFQRDPAEVARYVQAADIYIHPARADTFPCSVLEALACGTPVVATRVGGIPEQVEDSLTGFLVPPGDVEAMTASVLRLLEDHDLCRSIRQEAVAYARRHFSLETQVDAYLDWYHELLLNRREMFLPQVQENPEALKQWCK